MIRYILFLESHFKLIIVMLTDKQIQQEIDSKNIKITPFVPENIGPSNFHLTLGNNFLIPLKNITIDFNNLTDQELYSEVTQESIELLPNDFILAQTQESIELDNNISAFIDGRTTLARLGLTIHQTATAILAGHRGIITLEIKNEGNFKIILKSGMKIAKLIFFKSEQEASVGYSDIGTYGTQTKVTGSLLQDDATLV